MIRLAVQGLAAIGVLMSSPIHAQTSEETVTFILLGLEAGSTSRSAKDKWKRQRTGELVREGNQAARLSVLKLGDCSYRLFIAHPGQKWAVIVNADFGKISNIQYDPQSGERII